MPVKRRVGKASRLDEYKLQELHEGPGTCLLADCGYYYTRFSGGDNPTEEQWAEIRQSMREDWQRHGSEVVASWTGQGPCWAETQFGAPR